METGEEQAVTPETNDDVEISIYYDFLEDQGIIIDRDPEEQDQWNYESKHDGVGNVMGEGIGYLVDIVVGGLRTGNVGDGDFRVGGYFGEKVGG